MIPRKSAFGFSLSYAFAMSLKIESVPVLSLRTDPQNARIHDQKNLDAIAGSLRQFGQRKPIVIAGDVVVAGNGTLAAAISLGWNQVDVVRIPSDWDADRIKAFALADNRTAELAEWDSGILAEQLVDLDSVGWEVAEFGFEPLQPPTDTDWAGALDGSLPDHSGYRQWAFSLSNRQYEIVENAIKSARRNAENVDNENGNANALEEICKNYVG